MFKKIKNIFFKKENKFYGLATLHRKVGNQDYIVIPLCKGDKLMCIHDFNAEELVELTLNEDAKYWDIPTGIDYDEKHIIIKRNTHKQ